jgi:hypothetical protein
MTYYSQTFGKNSGASKLELRLLMIWHENCSRNPIFPGFAGPYKGGFIDISNGEFLLCA